MLATRLSLWGTTRAVGPKLTPAVALRLRHHASACRRSPARRPWRCGIAGLCRPKLASLGSPLEPPAGPVVPISYHANYEHRVRLSRASPLHQQELPTNRLEVHGPSSVSSFARHRAGPRVGRTSFPRPPRWGVPIRLCLGLNTTSRRQRPDAIASRRDRSYREEEQLGATVG